MTVQIALRLEEGLLRRLDAVVAAREDLASRSDAIRQALERFVADATRDALDQAIVEGYQRMPQGTVDEWGDLEEQALHAAMRNARRLDAEDGGW